MQEPATPINLKHRLVPSYRLSRVEQQKIYERPTILAAKETNRGGCSGSTKYLGHQKSFGGATQILKTSKTGGQGHGAKESNEGKRRANFRDLLEEPDPKTPVLASTLSLTDAANILNIIDKINKNTSSSSARNSSVDQLGKLFRSQFERVSSYLQENLYNAYSSGNWKNRKNKNQIQNPLERNLAHKKPLVVFLEIEQK